MYKNLMRQATEFEAGSLETVAGEDLSGRRAVRVLMATPRYPPYVGGVERHVYEVGRRLARAGVDVTVLTTDPNGQLPVLEEAEGVHIRRVRAWPARSDYYFAPDVYKVVVDGKWDVVHCQGVHTLVAPLAMLAAWRSRIPYIVTFHSGPHTSRWRSAIRGLQWSILRPLLTRADQLIGVSSFEVEKFRKHLHLPEERFMVLPSGGDLPVTEEPVSQTPDRTLIVSVGRLEKYKGHHRIIAALPIVCKSYPDVHLRIVGTGPYEDTLRQQALDLGVADRVQIEAIPPDDRSTMAKLLNQAALVTQLSDYESQGIAVLEALALRRPVLVTDTAALHGLAAEGLVRAVPLTSTAEEMAQAVVRELHDPLVPSLVTLPTWENCTNRLQALYLSLCKDQQSCTTSPAFDNCS